MDSAQADFENLAEEYYGKLKFYNLDASNDSRILKYYDAKVTIITKYYSRMNLYFL